MKLEEAAAALGLEPDSSLDQIKAAYRALTASLHPSAGELDLPSRANFQRLSTAFTKLISKQILNETDDASEEYNSEEDIEEEDVHEMRAFMRMFMDLVGIFNEERQPHAPEPPGFTIPAKLAKLLEYWSSEEEDDDESDSGSDFYDSEEEEEVKLKDGGGKELSEADAKKKLKNQKKRAEKRRKLKEKKSGSKQQAEEDVPVKAPSREEQLRLAMEKERVLRIQLFEAVSTGDARTAELILSASDCSLSVDEREGSEDKRGQTLLHLCVSNFSVMGDKVVPAVAAGRLGIARYLLSRRCDLAAVDQESRSVLHLAAHANDTAMIALLLGSAERKALMDINICCQRNGWTPLHYAADRGNTSACKAILREGGSMTIQALIIAKDGSIKSKGPTPIELAKQRFKKPSSAAHGAALEAAIAELQRAADEAERARVEAEKAARKLEEQAAAERRKQLQKEQAEREKSQQSQTLQKEEPTAVDAKKKKKKDKKKSDVGLSLAPESPPQPVSSAVEAFVNAADLISRDELLNHLLNMGFAENDCMAAIHACGNNVDLAMTWLCDRPATVKSSTAPAPASTAAVKTAPPALKPKLPPEPVVKEKEKPPSEDRRVNKQPPWAVKTDEESKREQGSPAPSLQQPSQPPLLKKDPAPKGSSFDSSGMPPLSEPVPGRRGVEPAHVDPRAVTSRFPGEDYSRSAVTPPPGTFNWRSQLPQPPGLTGVVGAASNGYSSFSSANASPLRNNTTDLSARAPEFIPSSPSVIDVASRDIPLLDPLGLHEPFNMSRTLPSWHLGELRSLSAENDIKTDWMGGTTDPFHPSSFSRTMTESPLLGGASDGGLASLIPSGLFSTFARGNSDPLSGIRGFVDDPFTVDDFDMALLNSLERDSSTGKSRLNLDEKSLAGESQGGGGSGSFFGFGGSPRRN